MGDVLVLSYHAVSDTWPTAYAIRAKHMKEQLEFLVGRGYRGATFLEAVTSPPARKTLAVTFDDGYRSVIEHGLPILDRLGLPGTVFVPTRWVGGGRPMAWSGIDCWLGGPHEHELDALSWDEVRSLADRGWEIASHTRSHPHLRELDDRRLIDEVVGSRRDCEERLERPCRSIAYPYGEFDRRGVRAVHDAGYAAAAALPVRLGAPRPLEWPRVGVWRRETFPYWQQKVAPIRRRLVGSQLGERALRWDRRWRRVGVEPHTQEEEP